METTATKKPETKCPDCEFCRPGEKEVTVLDVPTLTRASSIEVVEAPAVYMRDGGVSLGGESMADALEQLARAQDEISVKVALAWSRISASREAATAVALRLAA